MDLIPPNNYVHVYLSMHIPPMSEELFQHIKLNEKRPFCGAQAQDYSQTKAC